MDNYLDIIDGSNHPPTYVRDLPLDDGELIVGVYENRRGAPEAAIVITDHRVLIGGSHEWTPVSFADIEDISFPPKQATEPTLRVTMRDGGSVSLPVLGVEGFTKDAFEFGRFLMRVRDDTRS